MFTKSMAPVDSSWCVSVLCQGLVSAASVLLVACTPAPDADPVQSAAPATMPMAEQPPLPVVALKDRTPVRDDRLLNAEATVPPQCYTRTEGEHNPCYTCHQLYDRRDGEDRLNQLDDGSLQGGYLFSDIGVTNHWQNLFKDRALWLDELSDEAILSYIAQDNYSNLAPRLRASGWTGFVPDLQDYQQAAGAFDERGLARDGSAWVAFNYKPFPGTFWPTNGSTDDVLIRLPEPFRTLDGVFNRDVYFVNLTRAELNLKNRDRAELWDIDEAAIGFDIDGDGRLQTTRQVVRGTHFIGDARDISLAFQQLPRGTEFMHSVRYVGVEGDEITVSPRMKELRYMVKVNVLEHHVIDSRYANERKEKLLGELPAFINRQEQGFDNGYGWFLQGFIEDYDGELRPQTFEERLYCMGCHSAIGTTIDSTFSLARKRDGGTGWSYIDLRGMPDAPALSEIGGEILNYLRRTGGGSEFRENPEMRQRWFDESGKLRVDAVQQADVYTLITPSRRRALDLNKAYSEIVRHQSYIEGRDATWTPVVNSYREVDESTPPLESAHRVYHWDIRLDWASADGAATPAR